MTRAYSYIRFSTPEQAAGDSLRRQTALAAAYCAKHKLTLDTEFTLQDLGKSGFTAGKQSALAAFTKCVEDGTIEPGSVLLVENLDRISRQNPRKAAALLGDIVDSGVDVVTLSGEPKRYSKATMDSGFDYLWIIIQFIRANDESEQKSKRVRAAFAAKRAKGEMLGGLPAWIKPEGGKPTVIAPVAAAVNRIFSLYVEGAGQQKIARTMSAERVAGKNWGTTYVRRILGWAAVIGRHTHKLADGTTEAKEGYFPAIVDVELWERAQAKLAAGQRDTPRSQIVQNVLGGLAMCPKCGGRMSRVNKGSSPGHTGTPKLVCNAAHRRAGCKYVSVDMVPVTSALQRLASHPFPSKTEGLDAEIAGAEGALNGVMDEIEDLVAATHGIKAPAAIVKKIAAYEAQADKIRDNLAGLLRKASETDTRLLRRRHERLVAALSATPFDPGKANAVLKECVSKVVVDYPRERLELHWRHNGITEISYANELKEIAVALPKRSEKRRV